MGCLEGGTLDVMLCVCVYVILSATDGVPFRAYVCMLECSQCIDSYHKNATGSWEARTTFGKSCGELGVKQAKHTGVCNTEFIKL